MTTTPIEPPHDAQDAASHMEPVAIPPEPIHWQGAIPFFLMHAGVFAIIAVGTSAVAVWTCVALYVLRMFAITGFYHRYFSHRTFTSGRSFQFLMGLAGSMAIQRGPLWWAAHHRYHHRHSDEHGDSHSPSQHGFWWAHMGWFLTRTGTPTRDRLVRDWMRYPELRFIDRFDLVGPVLLAALVLGFGYWLEHVHPELGATMWQIFVWGFVVSTVVLYHGTYTINSLSHVYGSQRFNTGDDSKNNWLLAILTLGEGWHNNHHHYPASARQGFYWWEIDLTYYGLKLLATLGVISRLKPVPAKVLERDRIG